MHTKDNRVMVLTLPPEAHLDSKGDGKGHPAVEGEDFPAWVRCQWEQVLVAAVSQR